MNLLFTDEAWDHYLYWVEYDHKVLDRLNMLIEAIKRDPFVGIGKPEPLRGNLAGLWSRRITLEHRLIYRCIGKGDERRIEVLQCRYHY